MKMDDAAGTIGEEAGIRRDLVAGSRAHGTYDRMLDMILNGELPAGTRLQERRLAETLDVSRTPVREALTRLEVEGFIERTANQTQIVRRVTVAQMMELLSVRRVLEAEAAGLAARRPDIELLAGLGREILALARSPNPTAEQHAGLDQKIHMAIADMAGNTVLRTLIQDLRTKTRMFDMRRIPERFQPACEEHFGIVERLMAGDEEGARKGMASHVDNIQASIVRTLMSSALPHSEAGETERHDEPAE